MVRVGVAKALSKGARGLQQAWLYILLALLLESVFSKLLLTLVSLVSHTVPLGACSLLPLLARIGHSGQLPLKGLPTDNPAFWALTGLFTLLHLMILGAVMMAATQVALAASRQDPVNAHQIGEGLVKFPPGTLLLMLLIGVELLVILLSSLLGAFVSHQYGGPEGIGLLLGGGSFVLVTGLGLLLLNGFLVVPWWWLVVPAVADGRPLGASLARALLEGFRYPPSFGGRVLLGALSLVLLLTIGYPYLASMTREVALAVYGIRVLLTGWVLCAACAAYLEASQGSEKNDKAD